MDGWMERAPDPCQSFKTSHYQRKCRRGEIRLLSGGSQRATEEEDGQEEEEAIIRLDAPASKKKPPPVTQLQRGASCVATVDEGMHAIRTHSTLPTP